MVVTVSVDANDICNQAIDLYHDIEKARVNGLKWTQELSAVMRILRLAGTQCIAYADDIERMFDKKKVADGVDKGAEVG